MDAGERCLPGPRGAPCGARGALGALSGGGIIGIRLPPSTLAFGKGLDVGRQDPKCLRMRDLSRAKYLGDPCKIALGATTWPFRRESWGWSGPRPLDRVPLGGERGRHRGLSRRRQGAIRRIGAVLRGYSLAALNALSRAASSPDPLASARGSRGGVQALNAQGPGGSHCTSLVCGIPVAAPEVGPWPLFPE